MINFAIDNIWFSWSWNIRESKSHFVTVVFKDIPAYQAWKLHHYADKIVKSERLDRLLQFLHVSIYQLDALNEIVDEAQLEIYYRKVIVKSEIA